MMYSLTGVCAAYSSATIRQVSIQSAAISNAHQPARSEIKKKKPKYNVQYLAQLTVGRQTSSLQCTNPVQLDLTGFLGNTPHLIKNDHAIGIQCI